MKPARSSPLEGLLVDKKPAGSDPADSGESRDVHAGGAPARRSTAPAAKTFFNIQDHHSDRAACVMPAASSCALQVGVPRHALGNPPRPCQLVEEPDGGVVDPRSRAFLGRHGGGYYFFNRLPCASSRGRRIATPNHHKGRGPRLSEPVAGDRPRHGIGRRSQGETKSNRGPRKNSLPRISGLGIGSTADLADWQVDMEASALSGNGFHEHTTVVLAQNPEHDGQAQSVPT